MLVASCAPSLNGDTSAGYKAPSCEDLLARTVALMRSGQVGDGTDELSTTIETLRTAGCPQHFDVYADYASAGGMAQQFGPDPCSDLTQYAIEPDAIELLRQDGLCLAAAAPAPVDDVGQPGGGIPWDIAIEHVGTNQRVCGPLAGTGTSQNDVFLNLGLDYPDPARFQIVIWDVGGLEPIAVGSTLCTTGTVTAYEGVAQIELYEPGVVEIYGN